MVAKKYTKGVDQGLKELERKTEQPVKGVHVVYKPEGEVKFVFVFFFFCFFFFFVLLFCFFWVLLLLFTHIFISFSGEISFLLGLLFKLGCLEMGLSGLVTGSQKIFLYFFFFFFFSSPYLTSLLI